MRRATKAILVTCLIVGFIAPALLPDTDTGATVLLALQIPVLILLVIFVVWPEFRRQASDETAPLNHSPLSVVFLLGVITAVISLALGAVTGTGAIGAQIFMYLGAFAICIYMFWPEIRSTHAARRPSSRRQ